MRKILTNAVDEIEVIVSARLDLLRKNKDLVEKKSKIIFMSRREIFTKPWLFQIIQGIKIASLSPFFRKKPKVSIKYPQFLPQKPVFNPCVRAVFSTKDPVAHFCAKNGAEKCEKFWQF